MGRSIEVFKALFFFGLIIGGAQAQAPADALVPAIMTFGDSSVDVGNNDYIKTLFRADLPPYGRDYKNHVATGRFCNGKLATDITAETLGFSNYTYPPAYLSPEASGKNLLIGANFASAGSGFYDDTSYLAHAIPLSQQLDYFREYKSKLPQVAGDQAESIISGALYLVSSGSSDFIQNYYINPCLYKTQSPDQFASFLVGIFTSFVKDLYALGARKIGVTGLPPIGCVPSSINLFGHGSNECVRNLNSDAQNFNWKMNASVDSLGKELPDLKIVLFDIYQPFLDLVNRPSDFGFFEARRGCCGTGTVETTTLLCNPHSHGTCSNATGYVFWDSVHPTESANQVLADALLLAGINLVL